MFKTWPSFSIKIKVVHHSKHSQMDPSVVAPQNSPNLIQGVAFSTLGQFTLVPKPFLMLHSSPSSFT